ncbi:MAG: lytic transglycosylase domain-containing protein [Pyrinomonadaceae bacterium]|nr:lytic transglycosylase domain-containing protein [Pyrinomonadaceae bacterium]
MKRLIVASLVILTAIFAAYFFNRYWIHRYDGLIARQANIYRLDPDLVWSIIYEETYFSPWKIGKDGEIGLMQVTPGVGRDWAAETGMRGLERQMANEPFSLLRDPERNVQVGCWYLEKFYEEYRDTPGAEARMIAAYNAGPSRAAEWNRPAEGGKALSGEEFIQRINIPSTRAYVISILERYRKLKGIRSQTSATVISRDANVRSLAKLPPRPLLVPVQPAPFE